MKDFIKDLDEVKTSFRGYDRDEMMLYIKDLLHYFDQEKKDEMQKLIEQNSRLQADLEDARSHEAELKERYDALLVRFEKLSDAMSENTRHTVERDAQLDEFHRKQDEIDSLMERTRQEAAAEKEKLLKDADIQCRMLIAGAEENKKKIEEEAEKLRDEMLYKTEKYVKQNKEKADSELNMAKADAARIRKEISALATKLAPILFPEGKPVSSEDMTELSGDVPERERRETSGAGEESVKTGDGAGL